MQADELRLKCKRGDAGMEGGKKRDLGDGGAPIGLFFYCFSGEKESATCPLPINRFYLDSIREVNISNGGELNCTIKQTLDVIKNRGRKKWSRISGASCWT